MFFFCDVFNRQTKEQEWKHKLCLSVKVIAVLCESFHNFLALWHISNILLVKHDFLTSDAWIDILFII